MITALVLLLNCAPAVYAANDAQQAANELCALGLFRGTGTGKDGQPKFELDRVPTRAESVTILVRLLGPRPISVTPTQTG